MVVVVVVTRKRTFWQIFYKLGTHLVAHLNCHNIEELSKL